MRINRSAATTLTVRILPTMACREEEGAPPSQSEFLRSSQEAFLRRT
jgi:hypothetical protein